MSTLLIIIGILTAQIAVILLTVGLILSDIYSRTTLARVLGWSLNKQYVLFAITWVWLIYTAFRMAQGEGLP